MLSYRHAFHAGNHADVLKHFVLVCLLRYLAQKDKPFWSSTPTPAPAPMAWTRATPPRTRNTRPASAACGRAPICRRPWRITWNWYVA